MLKRFLLCLVAVSVCSASQSAYAQDTDFFFSFSNTSFQTSTDPLEVGDTGTVYIFSNEAFTFDSIDLGFESTNPSVISFTGGQGFGGVDDDTIMDDPDTDEIEGPSNTSPFFNTGDVEIGGRFNNNTDALLSFPNATEGLFFGVSVTQLGVNPDVDSVNIPGVFVEFFDPDFVEGVGSLLAEVEFTANAGGTTTLSFITPGENEIIQLPSVDVGTGASFGSVSVTVEAIPEPSSAVLMVLGLAGFAARRRR